jgi:hypothetical protein
MIEWLYPDLKGVRLPDKVCRLNVGKVCKLGFMGKWQIASLIAFFPHGYFVFKMVLFRMLVCFFAL